MNPALKNLNNNQNTNNFTQTNQMSAKDIFNAFQNSNNPKDLAFQMLGGNPEIMNALKNGSSYKQIAMSLLKQQGKSLGDVLNMFR